MTDPGEKDGGEQFPPPARRLTGQSSTTEGKHQ